MINIKMFVLLFIVGLFLLSGCSSSCVKDCKEQLTFSNVTCNQQNVDDYASCLDSIEKSSYKLNNICENRCNK